MVRYDDAQASMEQIPLNHSHQPYFVPHGIRMGIGARNKRQWDELFGVRSSGIIALTAMASSFNGAGLRLERIGSILKALTNV